VAVRFCSLLSGGKDSNYALYRALLNRWEPACILIVESERKDSWMFHTIATGMAKLQAEAMGLGDKVRVVKVSGVKEREVEELARALESLHRSVGFDIITVGALASSYQRRRIEGVAERLGVEIYAPAWMVDHEYYMKHLVSTGFKIVIARISTMGLPHSLLGKVLSLEDVEEIVRRSRIHGFHPAFEGGEAETLVIDAPHYRKSILIEAKTAILSPYESELVILGAALVPKGRGGVRVSRGTS